MLISQTMQRNASLENKFKREVSMSKSFYTLEIVGIN